MISSIAGSKFVSDMRYLQDPMYKRRSRLSRPYPERNPTPFPPRHSNWLEVTCTWSKVYRLVRLMVTIFETAATMLHQHLLLAIPPLELRATFLVPLHPSDSPYELNEISPKQFRYG